MRFQVPQFIEVEDKIFGPLTFKQFIYLAGAGGVTLAAFSYFSKFLAILISMPFIGLGLALAFYKINNRPFINIVESYVKYMTTERLYIWRKDDREVVKKQDEFGSNPSVPLPKLSNSKLKDLSWSLNVKKNGEEMEH
jgi:hypothetical protein